MLLSFMSRIIVCPYVASGKAKYYSSIVFFFLMNSIPYRTLYKDSCYASYSSTLDIFSVPLTSFTTLRDTLNSLDILGDPRVP